MSEVNVISNVDNKNSYSSNTVKKSTESSADFSSYLGETKTLDDIFKQAANKYNISEELLKAIGKAESNFNTKAVSRCGAQGVMQLMPATAKELGVTDSFDAEQNIMGGAKYIAGLLKKYDGNTKLALAAYNAGSGNVAKYGGIPPFTETQNYVKKIMNYLGQGDIQIADAVNHKTNSSQVTNKGIADNYPSNSKGTVYTASVQRNVPIVPATDTDSATRDLYELNSVFSYEDYLRFIELLLDNEEEEDTKEKNTNSFATQDINFNIPIMNLLKDQSLI